MSVLINKLRQLFAPPGQIILIIRLLTFRFLGLAVTFLFGLYVARNYGASAMGTYYLFVSFVTGISVLVKFGQETALIRAVGEDSNSCNAGAALFQSILLSSGLFVIIAFSICFADSAWIAKVFKGIAPDTLLAFGLPTVPVFVILGLSCSVFRGLGKPHIASGFDTLLLPIAIMLALIGLEFLHPALESRLLPVTAYIAALYSVGVLSAINCLKVVSFEWRSYVPSLKKTFVEAWPLFGVSLIVFLSNWSASYILAIKMTEVEVGIYNICWRLVVLIGTFLMALNHLNAPVFARLYKNGEIKELELISQKTSLLCLIVGFLFLGSLSLFSGRVLSIFGPEFVAGKVILIILAMGQLISMACGSVGYLLMMTGNGKYQRNINIATLILLIAITPFLIDRYGMAGAAIGTATIVALNNLSAVMVAKILLGINVLPTSLGIYTK